MNRSDGQAIIEKGIDGKNLKEILTANHPGKFAAVLARITSGGTGTSVTAQGMAVALTELFQSFGMLGGGESDPLRVYSLIAKNIAHFGIAPEAATELCFLRVTADITNANYRAACAGQPIPIISVPDEYASMINGTIQRSLWGQYNALDMELLTAIAPFKANGSQVMQRGARATGQASSFGMPPARGLPPHTSAQYTSPTATFPASNSTPSQQGGQPAPPGPTPSTATIGTAPAAGRNDHCWDFQRGKCTRVNCMKPHVYVMCPAAAGGGFCRWGANCRFKH